MSNEIYPYTYIHPNIKEAAKSALVDYEKIIALNNAKKAYNEMSPLKRFFNKNLMSKIEKMETIEQIENASNRFSR